MSNFLIGIGIGMLIGMISLTSDPKHTQIYMDARKEFTQEAFERGYMEKEIGEDDKVIYNWIEK